jgi:hypothetical protein
MTSSGHPFFEGVIERERHVEWWLGTTDTGQGGADV